MRRLTLSPRTTTTGVIVMLGVLTSCQGDSATASRSSTTTIAPAPVTTATAGDTTTTTTAEPSPTTAAPTTTTTTAPTTTITTTTTTTTIAPATTSTTTSVPATASGGAGGRSGPIYDVRPASEIPPPALPAGWSTGVVGYSSLGREIAAFTRPVEGARRTVLVIGGLHGNEPVTPPTVRGLVDAAVPDDVEIWLVPEANPDGVAAGTRWNGNGVDLNRNFGWDWRASDGGPGPLSEPETQTLAGLIERLEPDVVVWVHQPLGYVGSIGPTDRAFEQAWAAGSGTPVRSGVTQHGGGESWTAFVAGLPSMLIEIDSWAATPGMVAAHRGGFEALVAALA